MFRVTTERCTLTAVARIEVYKELQLLGMWEHLKASEQASLWFGTVQRRPLSALLFGTVFEDRGQTREATG